MGCRNLSFNLYFSFSLRGCSAPAGRDRQPRERPVSIAPTDTPADSPPEKPAIDPRIL